MRKSWKASVPSARPTMLSGESMRKSWKVKPEKLDAYSYTIPNLWERVESEHNKYDLWQYSSLESMRKSWKCEWAWDNRPQVRMNLWERVERPSDSRSTPNTSRLNLWERVESIRHTLNQHISIEHVNLWERVERTAGRSIVSSTGCTRPRIYEKELKGARRVWQGGGPGSRIYEKELKGLLWCGILSCICESMRKSWKLIAHRPYGQSGNHLNLWERVERL